MNKREFITLLGGAAAAWPLSARTRETTPVVGFLSSLSASVTGKRVISFGQGLSETGYVVGRDLIIEQRLADGQYDRLPALAADLVNRRVNLIAALAPPAAFAAKAATATIPIVFITALDPVKAGLVASLNRPGGNITGITFEYGIGAKWLELLKEIAPHATRVAVLRDPSIAAGPGQLGAIQSVAPSFGVEVNAIGVRDAGEIENAITAFARRSNGGLIVLPGAPTATYRDLIITLAAQYPHISQRAARAQSCGWGCSTPSRAASVTCGCPYCREPPNSTAV